MGLQRWASLLGFLAAGYPRELLPAAAQRRPVGRGGPRAPMDLHTEALLRSTRARRAPTDLEMPLESARFIVFDVETTGFQAHAGDEIIDLAAVEVVGRQAHPEHRFASLVRPRRRVRDEILRLTGLDPERIEAAPPLAEVLAGFLAFAGDGILVAYGLRHDLSFLNAGCRRLYGLRVANRAIDAWQTARYLHPGLADHSLDTLIATYGVPSAGRRRHTALGDSLLTAELWTGFVAALQDQGITTLRALYAALART
ncbi:MAG TPA: exonuclease domain-containing protein [Limnochordia bacterium]